MNTDIVEETTAFCDRPNPRLEHRDFFNPSTGECLRFDYGKPGTGRMRSKDHYHRLNPNSTGRQDYYLDKDGNAIPKGSSLSYLFAGDSIV